MEVYMGNRRAFLKLLINDKKELLKYKEQILALFKYSFGKQLNEEIWKWAYIDNPNGSPIVSLYFDKDKLVGHYAVIPVKFIFNQKNINAVLSMTTMVDIAYRRSGVFIGQANDVYQRASQLGYKFVFGFPNTNSAPGFRKKLNWVLEKNLYVATFSYDELQLIEKKNYSDAIYFNIYDKENLEWRLSKPNQEYFKKSNNILKKFENKFDIVFYGDDFSTLDKYKNYNLLLDYNFDKHLSKKQFDYVFGYRFFDASLEDIKFKKDLIMSDVF